MTKHFTLALGLLLGSSVAFATTFTLTNNQNGNVYQCGGGGSNSDPDCVKNVNEFCDDETTYSSDQCFRKAADACSNGSDADCVKSVFETCDNETTLSSDQCFEESIASCGGKSAAIRKLMRSAARKNK